MSTNILNLNLQSVADFGNRASDISTFIQCSFARDRGRVAFLWEIGCLDKNQLYSLSDSFNKEVSSAKNKLKDTQQRIRASIKSILTTIFVTVAINAINLPHYNFKKLTKEDVLPGLVIPMLVIAYKCSNLFRDLADVRSMKRDFKKLVELNCKTQDDINEVISRN